MTDRYNPFRAGEALCRSEQSMSRPAEPANSEPASSRLPLAKTISGSGVGSNRYTTSFPDPFGDDELPGKPPSSLQRASSVRASPNPNPARSNSVTLSPFAGSSANGLHDDTPHRGSGSSSSSYGSPAHTSKTGGGAISSFLNRATSVTSASVTDRMSEAMGTMRSAVDSLSSQIQQAVPGGGQSAGGRAAERLFSSSEPLAGWSAAPSGGLDGPAPAEGAQPSTVGSAAASYLSSKFSNASQSLVAADSGRPSEAVISRQRVLLVLEEPGAVNWAAQFQAYRKLAAGQPQSALTSFLSTASASLALVSTGGVSSAAEAFDLVEQADFRDVTVLANQSRCTATVLVAQSRQGAAPAGKPVQAGSRPAPRVIRPEYVIVRQRANEQSQLHMASIMKALSYCMVPMLEPYDIWSTFQDRQLIFGRLLRIQKQLGKEKFPLIPQVFCQTSQDLVQYLQRASGASSPLPCLARMGPAGKGRIKADSVATLKSLAAILAGLGDTAGCTLEPYLDVKYDLIIQKMGSSLKLFKRSYQTLDSPSNSDRLAGTGDGPSGNGAEAAGARLRPTSALLRQASIGSSVLSSLISSGQPGAVRGSAGGAGNQQASGYEKLAEMSVRYKSWLEAISQEFEQRMQAFCLKVVVTQSDREYIVGLNNCSSMCFLGSPENQAEDRRNLVELIVNHMDSVLPRLDQPKEGVLPPFGAAASAGGFGPLRRSSDEETGGLNAIGGKQAAETPAHQRQELGQLSSSRDKAERWCATDDRESTGSSRTGQFSAANQPDYLAQEQLASRANQRSGAAGRRELGASMAALGAEGQTDGNDPTGFGSVGSLDRKQLHQRQASLGQSLLDQTSTAFSSFQKQSWSFLRRLDSRAGEPELESPTRLAGAARIEPAAQDELDRPPNRRNGYKSQSMDCSSLERAASRPRPPKPPPPPPIQMLSSRSSSTGRGPRHGMDNGAPTPAQSRQNSATSPNFEAREQDLLGQVSAHELQARKPVLRQNSALSAFEPYDPELAARLRAERSAQDNSAQSSYTAQLDKTRRTEVEPRPATTVQESLRQRSNMETVSIASGDSNSASETSATEDTMNNLKRTFASIFGDKCEK